jgi:hypothetical protein
MGTIYEVWISGGIIVKSHQFKHLNDFMQASFLNIGLNFNFGLVLNLKRDFYVSLHHLNQ